MRVDEYGVTAVSPPATDRVTGREAATRTGPWLSYTFAIVAALWVVVVGTGALGPLGGYGLFALGIATLAAMVSGIFLMRPSVTWPWWAIATALALFLAGVAVRAEVHNLGNLTASRSLLPDFIVVPGYLLLAAGLLGFSRARAGGRGQLDVLLDALMVTLALAAVAWAFVIDPLLAHRQTPLDVRVVIVCYPALSCFLVVALLRIAYDSGEHRVAAYWFLLAAVVCLLIGDTIYLLDDVDLIRVTSDLLNLPYGFAFAAAGAGALHPSMRIGTEPGGRPGGTSYRTRILLVAIGLAVPAAIVVGRRNDPTSDRIALSLIVLALTATAILRIVQALRSAARSEARLAHQATHDSLTALPNRRLMEQQLSRALERSGDVALLFLDLDRFKLVNDTMGHSHGDELLMMLAERLREHVRPGDVVTRIGGDEFVIVIEQAAGLADAREVAERLRQCLRDPFVVEGSEFYLSASIGLSYVSRNDPPRGAEVLLREADTAMYQAKDAGRDTVAVFNGWMRTRMAERLDLENHLRHAVERRELYLLYQPIVRLPQGPVEGVEALVRWNHPNFGILGPSRFVPLAEESGLIGEIGTWVLGEAVRQLTMWCRQPVSTSGLFVAVNLSAAQLYDDELVDHVSRALDGSALPPAALCLELTESVMMDDPSRATSTLEALRELGVQLAIDDFGTEYSSLAYLRRFPVHRLKIDRSFVDSIAEEDHAESSLVAAMVAMASALGLTTVAEGVETIAQARRLVALGCEGAQGYLYGRPVKAPQLPGLVSSLQRLPDLVAGLPPAELAPQHLPEAAGG